MKKVLITWSIILIGSWITLYVLGAFVVTNHFFSLHNVFTYPFLIVNATISTAIFMFGAIVGYIVKRKNELLGVIVLALVSNIALLACLALNVLSVNKLPT